MAEQRSPATARVLVVDDQKNVLVTMKRALELEGYRVEGARGVGEALARLREGGIDVAVVDVRLGDGSGMDLLAHVQQEGIDARVIVMSGHDAVETAVEATRRGADDFLDKPVGTERLLVSMRNVLRIKGLEEQARAWTGEGGGRRLVGGSAAMAGLRACVAKAAPTGVSVLVTGERGSGKELVARALHDGSPRAKKPYVKLNCAAVPDDLVESELFGHERGAFTGAVAARRGKFEAADGGTLFLDEVGDMDARMQAKLLRALQEHEIEPVGGAGTRRVDGRVIAATNRDLPAMVEREEFRADLYDRLAVFLIETPPLRARREDVAALVHCAVERAVAEDGLRRRGFTDEALEALAAHDWPGNVRELFNAVARLLILGEGDAVGAEDVALVLAGPRARRAAGAAYVPGRTHQSLMDEFERALLTQAMAAHGGSMEQTARALGLSRTTAFRRADELGVTRRKGAGAGGNNAGGEARPRGDHGEAGDGGGSEDA
ncbi:MAG TPA: sigma-54 dependent transcriptional regulator [Myxococcota bacterium]|nr:sigma-54 dependent transcriptional regulator [Myxococcota bacterium]